MKFRTEIDVPKSFGIRHEDRGLLLGSCFAEHLANRLLGGGFELEANPFGIVYNPASMAQSLRQLIEGKVYTSDDLFCCDEIYHSYSHHSRFSGRDPEAVLTTINATLDRAAQVLREASYLILTFGTAGVYRLRSTGQVVSNCHKQPAALFDHRQLSVADITALWNDLLALLQSHNPNLHILLTVSPVRHNAADLHANRLSKATLLLALDELLSTHPQCSYFPSYELLEDDLRDYRFYAADLLHPNDLAIEYVWEKFSGAYFDAATRERVREGEREGKRVGHRGILG